MNLTPYEITSAFIQAMIQAGIEPHDCGEIVPDGNLHRFRIAGDKPGTRNGFFTLHLDGVPAGHFGSWKLGISQSWCAVDYNELTASQREENRQRVESSRQAAAALLAQKHDDAAERAARIWELAAPASKDHPYLVKKGIAPGIARQQNSFLVLPIVNFDGRLAGLQYIQPDGTKRMLAGSAKRGNFIPCSLQATAARVLICEGFATGQTLCTMEPQSIVLAAVDAGNVEPVAIAARHRWQSAEIVIACDFDDVGRAKGLQAARSAQAILMRPPEGLPPEISDWNDWAAMRRQGRAA
ncbi:MAG: toprim domain-containing protein [Halothiobacillaceae bacterium]|nr:toprim domain-containing protein [Halothiobacillaceae bacterium]